MPSVKLDTVYSRYAMVRLDALMECYDLLMLKRDSGVVATMLRYYIHKNAKLAFADKNEPNIRMSKRRQALNHISLGTSRGL